MNARRIFDRACRAGLIDPARHWYLIPRTLVGESVPEREVRLGRIGRALLRRGVVIDWRTGLAAAIWCAAAQLPVDVIGERRLGRAPSRAAARRALAATLTPFRVGELLGGSR